MNKINSLIFLILITTQIIVTAPGVQVPPFKEVLTQPLNSHNNKTHTLSSYFNRCLEYLRGPRPHIVAGERAGVSVYDRSQRRKVTEPRNLEQPRTEERVVAIYVREFRAMQEK
ncbi:MAG: hypothetical protein JO129_04010 [Candidatus Dependentiae bacterium]|nr:hypothetical protein [Candidatus Dependentiae bacterium]